MKLALRVGGEGYGHVGPFGLCNGTFDGDVINPPVIIMTLSLGLEVDVGTPSNCKDCAVCGESVDLLWRFLDLRWRRRWWIGFGFDMGVVLFGMGYVICGTGEGMLSVELVKVEYDWLLRSGMTGRMLGDGFGCYDRLVVENAKGRMENIASGEELIARCD
jgi:hypothetical protein